MRSHYTIPIAIIAGGLITAGAVYFSVRSSSPGAGSGQGNPSLVRPISASDHILGNPTAKVQIITYTDFDCDFCKAFHRSMREVIANAGTDGNVAWVYRAFPLTELHPNAFKHAQAAECAAQTGGNDAFWKFADSLFDKQPVDPGEYGTLAISAGAPGNAFVTCYASVEAELDERIRADRQNALDAGAVGTPFSILLAPGKTPVVIDGAYTADAIQLLIDQALQ